MPSKLNIREGLERSLVVSDHNRNLHGKKVAVYLFYRDQKWKIGEQQGTEAGVPFVINLDFSIPPPGNIYTLEVAEVDGPILYPQDETVQEIEVFNAQFNDDYT